MSGNSKTIIDHMFSNIAEPLIKNVATGNIIFSISNHLPQFFFLSEFLSNNYTNKRNAEVYNWSSFNKTWFLDSSITNWNSVVEIEKNNVNISFHNYLSNKNFPRSPGLLQLAIQNSIHKITKLFKKYIKCQSPVTKNDLHREYKCYRNKVSKWVSK